MSMGELKEIQTPLVDQAFSGVWDATFNARETVQGIVVRKGPIIVNFGQHQARGDSLREPFRHDDAPGYPMSTMPEIAIELDGTK